MLLADRVSHVSFSARAVFQAAREHQRKHAKIQGHAIIGSFKTFALAQSYWGKDAFS